MPHKSLKVTFGIDGVAPIVDINSDIDDGKLSKEQVNEKLGLTEPRFIELGPVAIFREGEWNGHSYTRDDIMEMPMNFHRMLKTWRPSLKISHEQGWFLLNDEHAEEANGKITDMWESKGVVYANFEFLISFYVEKIAGHKLTSKSVEIFPEMDYNGVIFNNVISNVALLGISMPGCGELGEIEDENTRYRFYSKQKSDNKSFTFVIDEEGNGVMPDVIKDEQQSNEKSVDENSVDENSVDIKNTEENKDVEEAPEAPEDVEENKDVEEDEKKDVDESEEDNSQEEENKDADKALEDVEEAPEDVKYSKEDIASREAKIIEKFNARMKAMEEIFMARDADRELLIEEMKKEKIETAINTNVESLIEHGHLRPADRELCKEIFRVLGKSEKVNFAYGNEVIEDVTILFNNLLKSYKGWQVENSNDEDDNINKDVEAADPIDQELDGKIYSGKLFKVDNAKEASMALQLQEKYKAEGKEVKYMDCYREVIGSKK